jgi:hypothetical protein
MQAKPPATNKRTREIRGSYHQCHEYERYRGNAVGSNKQTNRQLRPEPEAVARARTTPVTAWLQRVSPPSCVQRTGRRVRCRRRRFLRSSWATSSVRCACVRRACACARSPRTVGLFSPLPSATVLQRGALCCNVVYCAATWCTAMRPRKASVTNAGPPLDVRSFVGELQLGGFDPASTATGSVSYTPIRKTSATLSSHVPSIPALLAVYDPHSRYPYPYSQYRYPFSRHLYAYT